MNISSSMKLTCSGSRRRARRRTWTSGLSIAYHERLIAPPERPYVDHRKGRRTWAGGRAPRGSAEIAPLPGAESGQRGLARCGRQGRLALRTCARRFVCPHGCSGRSPRGEDSGLRPHHAAHACLRCTHPGARLRVLVALGRATDRASEIFVEKHAEVAHLQPGPLQRREVQHSSRVVSGGGCHGSNMRSPGRCRTEDVLSNCGKRPARGLRDLRGPRRTRLARMRVLRFAIAPPAQLR